MTDIATGSAGPPNTPQFLFGAGPIALFVFGSDSEEDRRKVYYLAEKQLLPITKMGKTLKAVTAELVEALSAKKRQAQ